MKTPILNLRKKFQAPLLPEIKRHLKNVLTCNSCVNSKALLFPSMLIDGTDSFKLSMKQTLLPVPVVRIMTYACLVTSG